MNRLLATQGLVLCGVMVAIATLGWQCARDPELVFLGRGDIAPWIAVAGPVETKPIIVNPRVAPRARFTRSFEVADPGSAELCFRAVRWARAFLNGSLVASNVPRDWKRESCAEIGPQLVAGTNEVEVYVGNWRGPRLLQLRVEGLPEPLVSDARWRVALGDAPSVSAILADDTREHPDAHELPSAIESLSRKAPALVLLFGLGVVLFAVLRRVPIPSKRLPSLCLIGGVLFWIGVWLASVSRIPAYYGFDSTAHGDYILAILREWRLPLASDGWSMFHPPLFHALAALWIGAVEWIGDRPGVVHDAKWLSFLAGAGQIVVTFALARRLLPRDTAAGALAVSMAAALPMNLYVAAYVSNESLHGLLAGVAILLTVELLGRPSIGYRDMAWLGAVLGLALLTKATALLVAVVGLGCIAIRLWCVDRRSVLEVGAGLALCSVLMLGIAGWFYVRNFVHFGTAMVSWDLVQHPGFRTGAYYIGFGESLRYPYFAGLHSAADALYSTLWADGLTGGTVGPSARHSFWSYDAMSSVVVLALPASGLMLFGLAKLARESLVAADVTRRLQAFYLCSLTAAFGLALVGYSLRLPFYSTIKSFFALALVAPLCVYFGIGAAAAARWLGARGWLLSAVFYGWLAALFGAIALAFTTLDG